MDITFDVSFMMKLNYLTTEASLCYAHAHEAREVCQVVEFRHAFDQCASNRLPGLKSRYVIREVSEIQPA
jgi:hypothetical protein